MITWLSFAINIVMLATWNAEASLTDPPPDANSSEFLERLRK